MILPQWRQSCLQSKVGFDCCSAIRNRLSQWLNFVCSFWNNTASSSSKGKCGPFHRNDHRSLYLSSGNPWANVPHLQVRLNVSEQFEQTYWEAATLKLEKLRQERRWFETLKWKWPNRKLTQSGWVTDSIGYHPQLWNKGTVWKRRQGHKVQGNVMRG